MLSRANLLPRLVLSCRHQQGLSVPRSALARALSSAATNEDVRPPKEAASPGAATSPLDPQDPGQSGGSTYARFVEPTRIQSLNIAANIDTMQKPGSIFYRYFLGTFDEDLFNYPFLLKKRKEFLLMNDQYEMIRSTFTNLQKNEEALHLLGYNLLYKLSVSEMMFIFEAMGGSVQKQFSFGTREDNEILHEKKMSKPFNAALVNRLKISEMASECLDKTKLTLDRVMSLIARNSLVYYALSRSSNAELKEQFINGDHNIGLALCEPSLGQTSEINKWKAEAKLSSDYQSWVVSGEKCKIIKGDYSHYLVFCRTNTFTEQQPFNEKADSGVVALLVPAKEVEVTDDGTDYFGVEYQTIKLRNVLLPRQSCEVLKAQRDISEFLNVKGSGQLACSALIVGMLKQLLKNAYAHLTHEKLGLTNCELVQYKLYQATSKIYALESMLYLTAAMYDSFETGVNLEGESITLKTLATEYAFSVCQDLRGIFGSRYPFASPSLDLIHSLDTFLDSSLVNRIRLGKNGIEEYSKFMSPNGRLAIFVKAPVTSVKQYLRFRKLRQGTGYLTREMTKFVHHNMHPGCDWIESCLNRFEYSNQVFITINENPMQKHNDLSRLAGIGMDIFMMIAVMSRANHSLCYGIRNNHIEKELCMSICKETFLKHLQQFEDFTKETATDNDRVSQVIFKENLKDNQYFAPLFRIQDEPKK